MFSYMDFLIKRCLWNNQRVLFMIQNLIMFADYKNLSMALNRLQEHGSNDYHINLIELGFQESVKDYSPFSLHTANTKIFILIYVDDILVTGCNSSLISDLIHTLHGIFHINDLGSLSYFLGVEADRTSQGLHLHQTKYICDILDRTKMVGVKPLACPTVSVLENSN